MIKTIKNRWRIWNEDHVLGGVIKNTGYLFSSNTIAMGLSSVQTLLATLLLGPASYGVLGLITSYASSINRLLSFRMGELVIKHAGGQLALGNKTHAAAIIKAAGLAEMVTSLTAYAILALLAPWAAVNFVKDPSVVPWILIYGTSLVADAVYETSTAVLQVGNHFRSQAILNLIQSILTTALIAVAFFAHSGIYFVLTAYLLGKVILGLGTTLLALKWIKPMLGGDWWKAPLNLIINRKELAQFAISTNLSGTINMVIRDSELLWVGYFLSPAAAGYYKLALAVMNLTAMPISQFINTTFPQISRSVARKEWKPLRSLLKRTSAIAAAWIGLCTLGMILVGPWFFSWYKNGDYAPSLIGMLILLVGFGAQGILFWNRPLLLALGKPNFPLLVNAALGAIKIILMFILVPRYGYPAEAALLSGYFFFSVILIVWRGLGELRKQSRLSPAEGVA